MQHVIGSFQYYRRVEIVALLCLGKKKKNCLFLPIKALKAMASGLSESKYKSSVTELHSDILR